MRATAVVLLLALAPPLPAAEPTAHRGLAYAGTKNEKQTLDVYTAPGGTGRPVVVWIHGGGWQAGDKKEAGRKPEAVTEKGYVFLSVNYRLFPEARIGEMAGDVAKAVRWVRDHAKEYGGDPDQLIITGHSAGAQLAALVCTDTHYFQAEGVPMAAVRACIPVDGDTYDVPLQIRTVEQRRAESYLRKFGAETEQKALSPITHVAKGKGIPPFLILHVKGHPEVTAQSDRLVAALKDAGVSARAYPAEGKTHVSLDADLGTPGDVPSREMFDFIAAALKK
ncbi:MAG TPA: alpha/beta hydrolase [Urbifossiella sp.]|jgi:acetyl esterase/lipase|nr:alpha/beta hydrolase [Urbifossiella sp.]